MGLALIPKSLCTLTATLVTTFNTLRGIKSVGQDLYLSHTLLNIGYLLGREGNRIQGPSKFHLTPSFGRCSADAALSGIRNGHHNVAKHRCSTALPPFLLPTRLQSIREICGASVKHFGVMQSRIRIFGLKYPLPTAKHY